MTLQPHVLRAIVSLCSMFFLFAAASSAKKKPPAQPININTANSEELQLVPGIGPVTAGKIVQMRKSYGAFKSVDDLLAIRGFGEKRLDKMRKYLTVGRVGAKPVPPAAPPATKPLPAADPPL
jgi:competence protein ComEA